MQYHHTFLIGYFVTLSGGSNKLDHIYDSYPTKSPLLDSAPQSPHPQFVFSQSPNVTAILHKTAHLNCRVKGVGKKTVSWIRHKDTHLLTAGRYTYTSDERFSAIHQVLSEDYLLQILTVKASDAGLYECQISTTPVMSHYVYLEVAELLTTRYLLCCPEPPHFLVSQGEVHFVLLT